jgi:hypothetical protein
MGMGNLLRQRQAWPALLDVLLPVLLLGGFVAGTASAQESTALTAVQDAFAAGDAAALLAHAAERIEIALLGQGKLYSRAQATYVMEDFFRRFPPVRFTLHHESHDDENWFATGRYQYAHGDHPLYLYVRLRLKGQRWEVREVRVEQRRDGP